jgi:transcriptional regulator with XRE-family HTH domain
MNRAIESATADLAAKIARLVEERGWNLESFARLTRLNRLTVRKIVAGNGACRLRNSTIAACAAALGLGVGELRDLSLERLQARIRDQSAVDPDPIRLPYEQATQPELVEWLKRHSERAQQLSAHERDELFSLQGTGGPLTGEGVDHFVAIIERKRKLLQHVQVVAGTEYLEMLEQFVELLYEKVQPYRDRR